eukprot:scaffold153494_cov40-Tisochrysis_lutea.AAC.2
MDNVGSRCAHATVSRPQAHTRRVVILELPRVIRVSATSNSDLPGASGSDEGLTTPLPASCSIVVDKGTLDCALVEGKCAALLCAVDKLMPPGGVYAVISFRQVHTASPHSGTGRSSQVTPALSQAKLLKRIFASPALAWTIETIMDLRDNDVTEALPAVDAMTNVAQCEAYTPSVTSRNDESRHGKFNGSVDNEESTGGSPDSPQCSTICILRKSVAESTHAIAINEETLKAQVDAVLDDWYGEEMPFLTEGREAELRAAWASALSASRAHTVTHTGALSKSNVDGVSVLNVNTDTLPLSNVYQLVFTPDERSEISFEDFEEDFHSFINSSHGRKRMASLRDTATGDSAVGLDCVLAFLQATQ